MRSRNPLRSNSFASYDRYSRRWRINWMQDEVILGLLAWYTVGLMIAACIASYATDDMITALLSMVGGGLFTSALAALYIRFSHKF